MQRTRTTLHLCVQFVVVNLAKYLIDNLKYSFYYTWCGRIFFEYWNNPIKKEGILFVMNNLKQLGMLFGSICLGE